MGSWMILEAYNDRYYTTGVTFQVENQPTETTVLGGGVDVGRPAHPRASPAGWTGACKPYEPGTNGGIVGTVFYDTTRNELDARLRRRPSPGRRAFPGLTMNLYATVRVHCRPDSAIPPALARVDPDGALTKGPLLNTTITETWVQPVDCQARDVDGNPVDQIRAAPARHRQRDCLEGPLMGTAVRVRLRHAGRQLRLCRDPDRPGTGQPAAGRPCHSRRATTWSKS